MNTIFNRNVPISGRKAVVNCELICAIVVTVPPVDKAIFFASSSVGIPSRSEYIMSKLTMNKVTMFVMQRFILI